MEAVCEQQLVGCSCLVPDGDLSPVLPKAGVLIVRRERGIRTLCQQAPEQTLGVVRAGTAFEESLYLPQLKPDTL